MHKTDDFVAVFHSFRRLPQPPKKGKHKRHGKDAKTDMKKPTREKGDRVGGKGREKESEKAYLAASFFLPSADLSPLFGMTQNLSSG